MPYQAFYGPSYKSVDTITRRPRNSAQTVTVPKAPPFLLFRKPSTLPVTFSVPVLPALPSLPSSRSIYKMAYYLRYPALIVTMAVVSAPYLPTFSKAKSQNPAAFDNSALGVTPEQLKASLASVPTATPEDVTAVNTLTIPRINLELPILESETEDILDKGIWRRPNTSTPDQGSNTVIVGHRFAYTKYANPFYDLDKVQLHDSIMVSWKGKSYIYEVKNIFVAQATQVDLEDPTSSALLTLYTCTPLLTGKDRLVIQAVPVQ